MKKLLLIIILAMSQHFVTAQNTLAIDTFFLDKIEKNQLAGAITLVIQDGEVVHHKPYGFLDIENQVPMNTEVIIPIASMTKAVTSIAIMQLAEQGKLQLDDPIEQYIPWFKDTPVLVSPDSTLTEELNVKPTVRDFMRHTSGMVYSGGNSVADKLYTQAGFRTWNSSLPAFVKRAAELPLLFQPGTKWEYSYSHDVLGYLIEVVSGITLDRYFEEYIFRPMGLKDTGFVVPQEKADRLSTLYEYREKSLIIDDSRTNSIYHRLPDALSGGGGWFSAYGGLLSTVSDYSVIAKVLLNYGQHNGVQILGEESVKAIISNQLGEMEAYGGFKYGLGVGAIINDEEPDKTKEIYWAGSPYNTYFWVDYEKNTIGILFTNTAPFGHLDIMNGFKAVVVM